MTSDEVPLMFQAQVEGRCQIQRVVGKGRQQFHDWADEWTKVCPKNTTAKPLPSKPSPTKPGQSSRAALMRSPHHALARPAKDALTLPQKNTASPLPKFGPGVKTKEYEITWRFVSNSGQDEGVIRPIIGAKGFPFYPGASMKGAFLRACTEAEALKYCGGKLPSQDTKPGILRFHGAYPIDTNWTKQLVDIVHSQQERQVIEEQVTRANAQISLYQPTLRFGISSFQKLDDAEWSTVWTIWEKALAQGIGSRVSAGYGQFKLARENQILQVNLKGQGLTSTLIDGTAEFRPNMFKAVLRGHTLRLFSGFTDEVTAQSLTKELWGGFAGRSGAIVGKLGVAFEPVNLTLDRHEYKLNHKLISMPVYNLERGVLSILCMQPSQSLEQRQALETLVSALVQFSILLGGFGKSWRRIHHRLFYPSYLAKGLKPMIGCHWEFIEGSRVLYHPVNEIEDISTFLNSVSYIIRAWITQRNKSVNQRTENWREAWHKVQVWGRFAANSGDSHAVKWFHDNYFESKSIYKSTLTGQMGKIGRVWHRMYPRYISEAGVIQATKGYVELLTIFPDDSKNTQEFLEILGRKNDFTKLWQIGN